ncbi:glycosyltransferase family 1 protein [Ornithobacterium rhinotracheale]|uniref:glycosyltransferase family 4 protein n=1 Tax=Ornithobacterium rhinotracheale TaxID=28251 RepID=UPI00129C4400|nr:glycosyltransferase family 4 protein [Ornithobacterium rhinotracheale]MRJ07402.1 glycosyltransferase family 1 protein [Ornithobacterium rhinotracheale]UOH77999.1 glycosyltransferase family 4 protein [Ornithobacterium rhinotracheale]
MKVLHLTEAKTWYGGEIQLADLLHNLKKLDVESAVFCYSHTPIEQYCNENGFKVYAQKKTNILNLAKSLKKLISENNIEVLHIHTSKFLTLFVIADFLYNLKVKSIYSKKSKSKGNTPLSKVKFNYKNIQYVIAVSQAIAESLKKVIKPQNQHKIKVIYDGIPMEIPSAEFNLKEKFNIKEKFLIGSIANHTEPKDLPTMVRTMDYLINHLKHKNVHLVQIGRETEHTPELKKMVEKLNLAQNISFLGSIEQAKRYISQFDLFLMTSESEGLPLVIYESFLSQTPIVSTKAGGIPEVIENGKNGFLAEIGDYQNLAKSIKTLLDSNTLSQEFAQRSYQKVREEFSSEICAQKTLNLYQKSIQNG